MKSFEYSAPDTIEEAIEALGNRWGETEIMAGGTDLVTSLKQRITSPQRVVSLKNISTLREIHESSDLIQIGAMTSLADLSNHSTIQKHFPSLVEAARSISSPQILNAGTLGGDLCQRPRCWYFRNGHGLLAQNGGKSLIPAGDNRYHAIFGNDGPAYFVSASSFGPPLIALGASVSVVGADGNSRQIALADFFRIPKSESERETSLKPNEILTAIDIPLSGLNNSVYEIRHRHGLDWPYATAAVAFKLSRGKASDVRIVLGHVAPTPWLASEAGKSLEGTEVTISSATRCGLSATQGAKTLSGNAYKVPMVKTSVKRAILIAAGIQMKG